MQRWIAIACLFASGSAGLIYEICWIRRGTLVFGSTTLAVSTVVALFFLGLALGAYVFGKAAAKIARPLRLFARLEIGVGILALLTLPAFDMADALYSAVYKSLLQQTPLLFITRIAIAALVLLPPTFLMGGALPLFCRQFVSNRSSVAHWVGFLYGANTLGATLGCLAAGLGLLPSLGLRGSIATGALLSFAAGLAALRLRVGEIEESGARETPPTSPRVGRFVAVAFFLVGFIALGYEILWTRYLGLLIRNTVHTYTITLGVVLLGIVLGSTLVGSRFNRRGSQTFTFGLLQVLAGLTALTVMLLPPAVWRSLGRDAWQVLFLLLPPSILSGATFPLAVALVVTKPSDAGAAVGRLTALNTLGGICGSFAVGFGGLPVLGMQATLLVLSGLGVALGAGTWLLLDRAALRPLRWALVATGLFGWILIPRALGTRIPRDFLAAEGELVDYKEGLTSNLAVVRRRDVLQLEIDRLWQGEKRKNHQALAAHIPMLLHPDPRRVLVVGIGAGQTPSRFLMYDVDRVDCVDLEPAVFDVIREHFDSSWMSDPRVELIPDDGRNFIAHSGARYDVISLEVGQIYRPGAAFFYTKDFYERARASLNPGACLSQFVPLPFFTPEQLTGVLRTFLSVFPESSLWYNTSELLLIGWEGEEERVDLSRLRRLLAKDPIANDLDYSHWGVLRLQDPDVFLGSFLMGSDGLREAAAGGSIYRDDRPVLDYATRDVREEAMNEIPSLDLLRLHLAPVATLLDLTISPEESASIAGIQAANVGDMVASACVRRASWLVSGDDIPQITRLLADALRYDRDNYDARRMMAEVCTIQRRFDEAAAHYAEAVRIRDDDPLTQRGLGTVLVQLKRPDEAVEHLRLSLTLKPRDPEALNTLGAALGMQGRFAEAIQSFEEALRLRPDYTEAQSNLDRTRAALRARG